MVFSLGSISEQVFSVVQDIPTSISGAPMDDMARQSLNLLNSFLKTSISGNNIDETLYENVLVNLTAARTLARMFNVGVDFSYTLGDFNVKKGMDTSANTQVEYFLAQAKDEMAFLGRDQFHFFKSNA